MSGEEPAASETLAQRLNYLFANVLPTAGELGEGDTPGREYTNREIAATINGDDVHYPDVTISAAYIGELRRGVTTDPRVSHCRALAHAFGVHPAYLVDDDVARKVKNEIALLKELRANGARTVALRTVLHQQGLTSDQIPLVQALVEQLAKRGKGHGDAGAVAPQGGISERAADP
jgi:transcriptional regulator with XRE-family HTH domain